MNSWKMNRIFAVALTICIMFVLLLSGCEQAGIQPPATVTFRKSMLDSTRVVQVTNRKNNETLVMSLHVVNRKKGEKGDYTFKVGPGETVEIGRLEMGWVFESGEKITLRADGYPMSMSGTVP